MTTSQDVVASAIKKHTGGCHCGKVRFEVELDATKGGSRCNCSICTMTAQTGAMVKPPAFKLVAGREDLSEYVWGSSMAKRFFCKHCGVHCYGAGSLEVLGGDFVSINLNVMDDIDLAIAPISYWDGRHDNWMAGQRDKPWPRKSVLDVSLPPTS